MKQDAITLFREGVRICRHGGSMVTAERKLLEAIRRNPSLAGKAYLALAAGADARIYDRDVVRNYRRRAAEHLRAERKLAAAADQAAKLVELARAYRTADTLADDCRARRVLEKALRLDPSSAIWVAKAKAVESIVERTFGSIGHLALHRARQLGRLPELLAGWTEIADSYSRAKQKTNVARWRHWLQRAKAGKSWALAGPEIPATKAPRRNITTKPSSRLRR